MSIKKGFLLSCFFLSVFLFGLSSALSLTGCTAVQKKHGPLLLGLDATGQKVYFSKNSDAIRADLGKYTHVYDIMTMEGQIDYLLTRMISTKHELFRNKIQYSPRQGTEFLRWKLGRPQYKPNIHSARDFVHMISSGSVTSGKPYEVILKDSSRHNLEAIFSNELALLEERERKMEKILLIEQVAFGGSA